MHSGKLAMLMVAGAVAVTAIVLGGRLAAPGTANADHTSDPDEFHSHLNSRVVAVEVKLLALNLMGQEVLPEPGPDSFFSVVVTIDCGGNATIDSDGFGLIPSGVPWQTSVTGSLWSADFTSCTLTPHDLPSNFVLVDQPAHLPFQPFKQDFSGSVTLTVAQIPVVPTPDRGSISGIGVEKLAIPASGMNSAGFTFMGSNGVSVRFNMAHLGLLDFYPLDPGIYNITESIVPGWTLVSITCEALVPFVSVGSSVSIPNVGAGSVEIDLRPSEFVICIFTNAQDGDDSGASAGGGAGAGAGGGPKSGRAEHAHGCPRGGRIRRPGHHRG